MIATFTELVKKMVGPDHSMQLCERKASEENMQMA